MTLTNNYTHAITKHKKTKTDYLRGLPVFVFIVNKLGPFKKSFHKLKLRVSSGFPNSFLVSGDPDETLSLAYEIVHILLK